MAACTATGQEYDGIDLSYWRTDDSGPVPVDWGLSMIEQLWQGAIVGGQDQYGPAAPQVYAIGTTNLPGPTQASVLTALIERPTEMEGSGPLRAVLVLHWQQVNGDWEFVGLLNAFVLGEEFLQEDGTGRGWMSTWQRFQR